MASIEQDKKKNTHEPLIRSGQTGGGERSKTTNSEIEEMHGNRRTSSSSKAQQPKELRSNHVAYHLGLVEPLR